MAKQRKNSYRISFLIDGNQRDLYVHTQAEKASVQLHVKRLISSRRTGAPALESEEWAAKLPRESNVKAFLIRWGLLEDNSDKERTIGDICAHFQKKNVKAGTLLTFKQIEQNLKAFFGENKLLRDIRPVDATDFENFLFTSGRADGKGGLSKPTAKKRIQRAKQFFIEARRLGWIDSNPLDAIHGGNLANPKKWLYIPRETVLEVMDNTPDLEIRAKIALCRFAGARGESEFNSLEWNSDWIRWSADGKQGTVRLHRQKTEDKGFEDTIIPMNTELEGALRDLFDSAAPGSVKVFTPRKNAGKPIKDQFRRNGIDIITPYNLRRSYCRDLMESGIDPRTYEYYAGHTLSVALKHYQSWDDLRAQKAAPKVLEALTGSNTQENNNVLYNVQQRTLQHSGSGRYIAVSDKKDDLSLENREYYKKTKSTREIMQGRRIGAEGFEPPTKGL